MNDVTKTEKNAEATEEKVLTPIEKCQIMHDKGMGEDEIIGALATHDGMSIMKAVGVFKKFQKSAGLILSKEDRQAKIEEIVTAGIHTVMKNGKGEEVDTKAKVGKTGTIETTVDLKGITAALGKMLDISAGAAKGHVRRYCKANEIEMPTRQQLAADALEEYKGFVIAKIKAGVGKAELAKALAAEYKSVEDEKAARRAVARIAKANDLTLARGGMDHSAVIAFLKEHGDEYATKDGLANALVAELGLSMSAAKRVFAMYQFAKQYAAPEVAEEEAEVESEDTAEDAS